VANKLLLLRPGMFVWKNNPFKLECIHATGARTLQLTRYLYRVKCSTRYSRPTFFDLSLSAGI
jgi:hypothetical protein